MPAPHRALLVAIPLALSAIACSGAGDSAAPADDAGAPAASYGDPLAWDFTKQGPFTCGHRVLSMTYAPKGLPSRTIPVHVWYPSTSTEGEHPKYQGLFVDEWSYEDAPYAGSPWKSGTLPVLVHSHGYKGFSGNSARLLCFVASHGWLAVAPTHVGNTLADTPDPLPLAVYLERPQDILAALDFVATKLPDGDALAGQADLGRVAISGHSFGTYTTWVNAGAPVDASFAKSKCDAGDVGPCAEGELAALAGDFTVKEAKAAIAMAGSPNSWISAADYDAPKIPIALMEGTLNPVGNDAPWAAAEHVDRTRVVVDGGCHQLFGLGNTQDPSDRTDCQVLPDEEGFALVNPWFLAFLRAKVLGDGDAKVKGVVDGTGELSPKVHVEHAGP